MKRFIRWNYVLPRLLLVALLLFVSEYGLGWAMRKSLIGSGEAAIGAKVEVGETRVSLLRTHAELRNVRVANPHSPMQNLLEADHCSLNFETNALLRKKAIVHHGKLVGLRFGTPRDTSGELPNAPSTPEPDTGGWLDGEAAKLAQNWLTQLGDRFQEDLLDQFQSIRLTEDLLARWPEQYHAIEKRVGDLREQANQLQTEVRRAQANPVRHAGFLARLPEQIATLRQAFQKLSVDVESLPNLIEADHRAIIAARHHDEELLREKLHFEKIEAATLTGYFLQESMSGPLHEAIAWLRWARQMVPVKAKTAPSERGRGQDVLFAGSRQIPDYLIRSLTLQGSARISDQPVELTGLLTNLTNQPSLHGQPTKLQLTAHGSLPLELKATLDRTGPIAKDALLLDCRNWVLPKINLGQPQKLQLAISPSMASLNISLMLEGDQLSGDIQLIQKQVKMTPTVGDDLEKLQLASGLEEALEETLGRIDSLATRVTLGGTLDKPEWKLWSNLGPAVAEAMDRALEQAIDIHAKKLLAKSQRRVDEQLARLDRQIAEQQGALLPQLAGSTDLLKQLVGKSSNGEATPWDQLGRSLRTNSLFR